MALINCPECQKQVSSEAPVCLTCGFPIKNRINKSEAEDKIVAKSDSFSIIKKTLIVLATLFVVCIVLYKINYYFSADGKRDREWNELMDRVKKEQKNNAR